MKQVFYAGKRVWVVDPYTVQSVESKERSAATCQELISPEEFVISTLADHPTACFMDYHGTIYLLSSLIDSSRFKIMSHDSIWEIDEESAIIGEYVLYKSLTALDQQLQLTEEKQEFIFTKSGSRVVIVEEHPDQTATVQRVDTGKQMLVPKSTLLEAKQEGFDLD